MGCTNANDDLYIFSSFDLEQQIKPQEQEQYWLCCSIVIAPYANNKASSFTDHLSKPGTACHQEGKDDGIMSTMAARTRSPLQQHDNFTMFAFNNNLVPTTSTCSTSTSSHIVWNNGPKLCTGLSLSVFLSVPLASSFQGYWRYVWLILCHKQKKKSARA